MPEKAAKSDAPVTIKKYANRRLYNTATSSYVTLDHLAQMVKEGTEFVVYDAKTGDDITRSVLTQIIMEEESKGHNLLPTSFLRKLITFYGDSLAGFVPRYLEMSMETFARNQEQMRASLEDAFGGFFPFKQIEDMGKANMAMFQRAIEMFPPFVASAKAPEREPPPAPAENREREIAELRDKLEAMQHQLDRLVKRERG